MSPLITGVHHLRIDVRDLDTACREYATLLGRPARAQGQIGGCPGALFAVNNASLELRQQEGPSRLAHLAFRVADRERMRRRLERLNLNFTAAEVVSLSSEPGDHTSLAEEAALLTAASHTRGLQLAFAEGDLSQEEDLTPDRFEGLDHVVIRTHQGEHSAALLGARLGLDLRADLTRPDWGARLMFFRCGDLIIEVLQPLDLAGDLADPAEPDSFYGLSWRVGDAAAAHRRLQNAGVAVSELRAGRRPGSRVFTVRSHCAEVPTLVIEAPATRPR